MKLKSQFIGSTGPSRTQLNFNTTNKSSRSSFHNLKRNMMDRILSKANMHDHIKHALGKPGGNPAGTYELESSRRARHATHDPEDQQKRNVSSTQQSHSSLAKRKFLGQTPSVTSLAIQELIKKYPKYNKDQKEENRLIRDRATRIIQHVNEALMDGSTKRYSNYVNMGLVQEKHSIQQVIQTADMLQDLGNTDKKGVKKAYNFRLVDELEKQERSNEVCAEYRSGQNDPGRFMFSKMEKGQYQRFRKK